MPDTKNWTWVLEKPCEECGFDASAVTAEAIGPRLRQAAVDLVAALEVPEAAIRPDPEVWSPLEYACHVRDTCRIFLGRLRRMLAEDDPVFENWDQDQTALDERYGEQDPRAVAVALVAAVRDLAAAYSGVSADQWDRTGLRSDGSRFTVLSLGQYLVHDPVHHVYDVTGVRQS